MAVVAHAVLHRVATYAMSETNTMLDPIPRQQDVKADLTRLQSFERGHSRPECGWVHCRDTFAR